MASPVTSIDVRELMRLLNATATMIGPGRLSAEEAVGRTLDLLCDYTGWPLAHAYLTDRRSTQLRPTSIWHAQNRAAASAFIEATMRMPITVGASLPGRVAASGRPLWIRDLSGDPRHATATACGLTAGVASPIVSARGIEGVMEFFPPPAATADEKLLDVLAHIGLELGTAFDRARTETTLADSASRLADAERLARIGTWVYDIDDDLLEWSAELRTLYGMEPDTAPTTLEALLSRVHPADLDRVRSTLRHSIETRQEFEHEYRLVLAPGDVRWAHSRGVIVPGSGRSATLAGYCQDITEQKQREEVHRRDREQLAEAERLAQLGSWSWEPISNQVTCSEELFSLFGLDPAVPPTYETFFARVHPDEQGREQDRLAEAVQRAVEGNEPLEHEFRILRPDGEVRWMQAHAEVVERAEGKATRLAGYTQDITDRRAAEKERARLESMLNQSQRLESLGQLAGGVAHDFNNLLSAILSYTAFVTEGLTSMEAGSNDVRFRELLADVRQIRRAAARGAELTRRLLTFGRRDVVRSVPLVLDDVIRGVEPFLRRSLGAHIELSVSLSADPWPVRADPGQLEQVLVNLAVNARDATTGAGRLAIETANVHIDAASPPVLPPIAPGRYVELRFSDTGSGMSADVAARAFEPFFTTKPKGVGSGLGLATVHGIVGQAGGGVRIESEAGAGATIIALWPATDAPGVDTVGEPSARTDRHDDGQTVLVVDDEAPLREATRRMLLRRGYSVLTASGGTEAIELARSHPGEIALLLTDIIMPHMLGKEVAAAVTALRPGIRVVYMSGYAGDVLTSNGALDSRTLLLEKPFSEEDLARMVRHALERPEPGSR